MNNLKIKIICLIISLCLIGALPVYSQDPTRYTVDDKFIPETPREKLANVLRYLVNDSIENYTPIDSNDTRIPSTNIPCHLLQLSYYNGFPADVTGSDFPNGVMTSEQYKNSKFSPIHLQKYEPGTKSYFKPVMYGFDSEKIYIAKKLRDEAARLKRSLYPPEKEQVEGAAKKTFIIDRNAFVEKFPNGEFVGWIKFKATKVDEPLQVSGEDGVVKGKHDSIISSNKYFSFINDPFIFKVPGNTVIKPNLYLKILNGRGNNYRRKHIVYEICSEPSVFPIEGDYSDLRSSYLQSVGEQAVAMQLFFDRELPPAKYDNDTSKDGVDTNYTDTPTVLAFWDNWRLKMKSDEQTLLGIEATLRAIQTPAYMVPLVGTGLNAVDCYRSSDPYCWHGVGLDAASDALLFLKVPAVLAKVTRGTAGIISKAKVAHKLIKNVDKGETYIVGIHKLLTASQIATGVGNLGLAAYYLKEGDILNAAGRGFAGGLDSGLFFITGKFLGFIPLGKWPVTCANVDEKILRDLLKVNTEDFVQCGGNKRQMFSEVPEFMRGLHEERGGCNKVWRSEAEGIVYKTSSLDYGPPNGIAKKMVEVSKTLKAEYDRLWPTFSARNTVIEYNLSPKAGPQFYTAQIKPGFSRNDLKHMAQYDWAISQAIDGRAKYLQDNLLHVARTKYPIYIDPDIKDAAFFDIGDGYLLIIDPNVNNYLLDFSLTEYRNLKMTEGQRLIWLDNQPFHWFDPYHIKTKASWELEKQNKTKQWANEVSCPAIIR